MQPFSVAWAAEALEGVGCRVSGVSGAGGQTEGTEEAAAICNQTRITGICTDTRKLKAGDLFFALVGENTDGHQYVERALQSGAAAAVVSNPIQDIAGIQLVVPDVLVALGDLARAYRMQFNIPLVAVTGSVGKTSTKEMVASVLKTRFTTLVTAKNYNNEIGVPLTLFELTGEHQAAVIEMGMRGLGEIDRLAEIACPTIGIITNIGHSHIELLGSREKIAQAKSELLARLPAGGTAILPRHDPYFDMLRRRVPLNCRIVTYSDCEDLPADVTVTLDNSLEGYRARFTGEEPAALRIPGPRGIHIARNAGAACAAGKATGISIPELCAGLQTWENVEGRMTERRGPDCIRVLDDCYNAAPESMAAALDWLAQRHSVGDSVSESAALPSEWRARRVAILGDMKELGEFAPELHRALGRQVLKSSVHLLVTVGELSREIAAEAEQSAVASGRPAPLHRHFETSAEAAEGIAFLTAPCDCILVKGSRAMQMEKIVTALLDPKRKEDAWAVL